MEFKKEKQQLNGAAEKVSEKWKIQNNKDDRETNIIYQIDSYEELLKYGELHHFSEETAQYAVHRWYNVKTSEVCERIFVEYGATKATDEENLNHIDIFINNVPFDVKISVFPRNKEVQEKKLDLRLRKDKDELIKWFYKNQSSGQRNCFNNRIFIVCEGKTHNESIRLKQDFDQMEMKIQAYMENLQCTKYPFNEVEVQSPDGKEETVKADIITISPQSTDIKDILFNKTCPKCGSKYRLLVIREGDYKGNIILKCTNTKCKGFLNV